MTKLTTAERNRLPDSAFAGPHRSFPVPDKAPARAAKSRASQAFNAQRITKLGEEKIDAKADNVLAKGEEDPKRRR